jgi:nucleotide-binding universal stress UspA family protein
VYKKILVPVDETEQSYSAVSLAGLIAAACGAALTLFHVRKHQPEVITDMVTRDRLLELPEIKREEATFKRCEQILGSCGMRAERKSVESENVAESIVNECRSGGYDAIVMGHRGRKHLKMLLLGSVANGVLVEARCTTIMVHVPGEEPE